MSGTAIPWNLWLRQTLAVLSMEFRKNFAGKRSLPLYLVTLFAVCVLTFRAVLIAKGWMPGDPANAGILYAVIFLLLVRVVVFFGCAWIFTNLFRGEIIDQSLHYYFLAPIRRDVLVLAKFASGLVASLTFFLSMTALTRALLYLPYGAGSVLDHLVGKGLGETVAYLGVTALACLGYGTVFLAAGLFLRNPFISAAVILGWESINFLLPPLLKKFSIIYYLVSLLPVQLSQGTIAFMAEPTSAWVSVPGLLALSTLVLWIASRRIRRTEIAYGTD